MRLPCVLLLALVLPAVVPSPVIAQPAADADSVRITALRARIAADAHPDAATGEFYLLLANILRDTNDEARAEDAYAHALTLSDTPATQAQYAGALYELANLYFHQRRLEDTRAVLVRSVAVYTALNDIPAMANGHQALAIVDTFGARYADAALESAQAVRLLNTLHNPPVPFLIAALVTHSFALSELRKFPAATVDSDRALALVRASIPELSPLRATVLLIVGINLWRMGQPTPGERYVLDALHVLRESPDLTPASRAAGELNVLRHYARLLHDSHRGVEAKAVDEQIARQSAAVEALQAPACHDCTRSAAIASALR